MNRHIIFSHYGRSNIFYPKGSVIFSEGSQITGIYYLQTGSASLIRTDQAGNQITIKKACQGEMIGNRCFFNRNIYNITAVTEEDSLVSFLDRPMLHKLIIKDPETTHLLLKSFCDELEEADAKTFTLLKSISGSEHIHMNT